MAPKPTPSFAALRIGTSMTINTAPPHHAQELPENTHKQRTCAASTDCSHYPRAHPTLEQALRLRYSGMTPIVIPARPNDRRRTTWCCAINLFPTHTGGQWHAKGLSTRKRYWYVATYQVNTHTSHPKRPHTKKHPKTKLKNETKKVRGEPQK